MTTEIGTEQTRFRISAIALVVVIITTKVRAQSMINPLRFHNKLKASNLTQAPGGFTLIELLVA